MGIIIPSDSEIATNQSLILADLLKTSYNNHIRMSSFYVGNNLVFKELFPYEGLDYIEGVWQETECRIVMRTIYQKNILSIVGTFDEKGIHLEKLIENSLAKQLCYNCIPYGSLVFMEEVYSLPIWQQIIDELPKWYEISKILNK